MGPNIFKDKQNSPQFNAPENEKIHDHVSNLLLLQFFSLS